MVSGNCGRMGVLDESGDCRRGRSSFGMNLGRPIITNGVGYALFSNYFGEDLSLLCTALPKH